MNRKRTVRIFGFLGNYSTILGLVLLAEAAPSLAQTPIHYWSKTYGNLGADMGRAVAVDAFGNVVVTGYYILDVDFGGGVLVNPGGSADIFVAKYSANGVHQWSQHFGDTAGDFGWGIAADRSENVIVTGQFFGAANFGGGRLVSAGHYDAFVAKFSPSGVHEWSHSLGGASTDIGYSVAVDGFGDVVVTGTFRGVADFAGDRLTSAGGEDIFLVKFDADGVRRWSQRFGSTGDDRVTAVAVDSSGNAVLTGSFQGTVNFGGANLVSAGHADIFVAKYDPSGVHEWSQRFGSTDDDRGTAVAVDGSGNVVTTGYFTGSVNFGGGSLVSLGHYEIFVAKYDADGAHQWSQRLGGPSADYSLGIAVDGSANLLVTGTFQTAVDFGGGDLVSRGGGDVFVAKYDAGGMHQWSRSFGETGLDEGIAVAADGFGNAVVTGQFQGAVDFGGGDVASAGANDVFVAKYGLEQPVPVLISHFDATPHPGGVDLAWECLSDEALDAFTLYRGQGQSLPVVIATGDARTTHSYTDTRVEPGEKYQYALVIRTASGDEFRSPMATASLPRALTTLEQNVPNPFNPRTSIVYTVGARVPISIEIFNASGALVRRLDQGVREAGSYSVEWDGRDASNRPVGSGVYFYRLSGIKGTETRKMVLVR